MSAQCHLSFAMPLNFQFLLGINTHMLSSTKVTLPVTIIFLMLLGGCQASSGSKGSAAYKAKDATPTINLDVSSAKVDSAAHFLTKDLIVSQKNMAAPYLFVSAKASIDEKGQGELLIPLIAIDTPAWLSVKHPHLTQFFAYQVDLPDSQLKNLLKQQLALVDIVDPQKRRKSASHISYVQTAKVLDQLYTQGANGADEYQHYGARINPSATQFSIWAPTATRVEIKLYDSNKQPIEGGQVSLTEDKNTGIWRGLSVRAPQGTYYRYQMSVYHPQTLQNEKVWVTDPYSLSLSTNSLYSQVVDLSHQSTKPKGWDEQMVATLDSPEQLILYETHIRDFSASDKTLSDPSLAGKYAAFSQAHSDSINHLKALREAGLNTVHLLPTYDITTVDELPANLIKLTDSIASICQRYSQLSLCTAGHDASQSLENVLSSFEPSTAQAQAVIEQIRALDPYNWGYDPYHYTVPEGSYALNPEGLSRLVEFRQMVLRLHQLGFRVIMDVVYNHTFAAGLHPKSVLDKVVPGYYHRLNPVTGAIEQSTCCDNTASEHRMMAKLMIDSLIVWSRDYKIDGFRFDLMGHQPKDLMLEARAEVQKVDPDTYFYGEGWNFGEVANNAQFVQATQSELAGTEIGTFTDRLRDAIRGGSSFVSGNDIRVGQGLGNGLVTAPNELHDAQNREQMMQEYLLSLDQARIGLAGNLAIFPLENAQGENVFGRDIDYGGAPTGYALDPADTVNYVSKHDNQTLWDNNQYRIASELSTEQRVRMQILSLAYPMLAQGIPFIHMGSELLRSKSFLRDSYDFGDWFNKIDFSKQSNNYNVGLPPADKDQANWDVISTILSQNEGRDNVNAQHIEFAFERFKELLAIRSATPLFGLQTADQIIRRIKFLNTGPEQTLGLIVMSIDDPYSRDLDPNIEQMIVIFNNNIETQTFDFSDAGKFTLHPVLQRSQDPQMKNVVTSANSFTVPGLTVAVFVR
ncbi:MAG: hypothetical protein Alis3KO_26020 [Aliiglaciecola sp.]